MIDDKIYFSVQAWMVTKLGLKGCERDVYAIIYGYSQDGESDYHGSLGYIAELTGYSKNSICTALKNLAEKNFIIKTEKEINNVKFCRYTINRDSIQVACTPIQVACINNKDNKQDTKKVVSKDTTTEFQFGTKKQIPKKDNLFTKCVALIDSYDFSQWGDIRKLLFDYLQFRMSVKEKPLYSNMWKGMLTKLANLCDTDVALYEAVIMQSIERGYLSFYPISGSNASNVKDKPWERNVHSTSYTAEELEELAELEREREAKGMRTKF